MSELSLIAEIVSDAIQEPMGAVLASDSQAELSFIRSLGKSPDPTECFASLLSNGKLVERLSASTGLFGVKVAMVEGRLPEARGARVWLEEAEGLYPLASMIPIVYGGYMVWANRLLSKLQCGGALHCALHSLRVWSIFGQGLECPKPALKQTADRTQGTQVRSTRDTKGRYGRTSTHTMIDTGEGG